MEIRKELFKPAEIALKQCMGLQAGENLLIVTNSELMSMALALFEEGMKITKDTKMVVYPRGKTNGEEPPQWVAEQMYEADVIIGITVTSITHTRARRRACDVFRARCATLPGITEDIFIRGLQADYNDISIRSNRILEFMEKAQLARVKTPDGSDYTVELGNPSEVSDGICHRAGWIVNLPDGEVECAPTNANGVVVANISGSIITEPTKIELKDGYIVSIDTSHESGKRFRQLINEAMEIDGNNNAEYIAEFAIGTNTSSKITGNVLEDEKVFGTTHVAFGTNTSYPGGTNNSSLHQDVIMFKPTIWFDEKMIMKDGELLV